MTEIQIIKILKGIQGLNLPSLNGEDAGESRDIKICNTTIYFTRANNEENVNADKLLNAYNRYLKEIDKYNYLTTADFGDIFTHPCQTTFFFQILKYFEIVDVNGNGVNGNPYTITAK